MDNIKRKIAALLNLAKGKGATEAEMQSAMAMAMKLAERYRYDLKEVEADSAMAQKEEEFITAGLRTASGEFRRPPCHKHVALIINRYLNVEIILMDMDYDPDRPSTWNEKQTTSTILMFGRVSDVEFAKFAYNYLKETYNRLWREYKEKKWHEAEIPG